MTLMKLEARKMFVMNRGILVIALFLLAELAVLIFGDSPADTDAALYREQYLAELQKVEGRWTREKADLLESEARDGEARNGEGFDVLYKQYLYVNEGREDRYFLDANGWAGLLSGGIPDIPLAAAVILLAVPVYCGEASCGMETLALTSRNGRRLFLGQKLALTFAAAAVLSLSADIVRLAFFAAKYGLPHGGYPMQSVESLGSAEKAMSLLGAEVLTAGLRLLGSLELAALTLMFSALCGQYALSAFLATAAVVLPWIGLDPSAQYALPLPSSLMAAAGFLRGSEYETDTVTGESAAVFREAGPAAIALTAAGAVLVCVLCVLMLRRRYASRGGRGAGRKTAVLSLAVLLCLCLAGCAEDAADAPARVVYNSRDARVYEYNGLTVSAVDGEITVTDGSGRSSPLVRDALAAVDGTVRSESFFASGKYVYLWQKDSEGYGEKLASDTGKTYITSLVRVDLDTFTSEIVFEYVAQHTVLGIDVPAADPPDFLGGGDFFADENYVYILGAGIRRVELRTGKLSLLDIPTNRNVAFDGSGIYYTDEDGALCRFDTDSGKAFAVFDGTADDFRLADGEIDVFTRSGEHIFLPTPPSAEKYAEP